MDTAALDTAGASASTLAQTGGTQPLGQAVLGPCLYEQMTEAALVTALNAWGSTRDREALALRADLTATQAGVAAAFEQAQAGVSATLLGIIEAFGAAAESMPLHAGLDAQQPSAPPDQLAGEALARFAAQDATFELVPCAPAPPLHDCAPWPQSHPLRVAALVGRTCDDVPLLARLPTQGHAHKTWVRLPPFG